MHSQAEGVPAGQASNAQYSQTVAGARFKPWQTTDTNGRNEPKDAG